LPQGTGRARRAEVRVPILRALANVTKIERSNRSISEQIQLLDTNFDRFEFEKNEIYGRRHPTQAQNLSPPERIRQAVHFRALRRPSAERAACLLSGATPGPGLLAPPQSPD
jgi:hypothetical protein